ncbi:hypothetical protein HXX76_008158 [Chlamydomonas incerta]|uniref:PKD/REJ-like domain-containing protein n=1 Tax=Chlamydomonas incerta TaxID=51695 RepID=A0A835T7C4_CHLIN|nr:hypothetical protein HXX76_008158 [Chlamydomonas incerta]|eukprot:KAG2433800.1 hypothetical protein HXX76_008158 [Chlamydomonas incerta]
MMCTTLQACPTSGCPSLTATKVGTSTTLSGALDLCAAEGVVGGTPTPLTSAVKGPGTCKTVADCTGAGMMCQFADANPPKVCECMAGRDECYSLGTCISYCSLNSTLDTISSLNAGTKTCDPASGGAAVCAATETCATVSGCQQWSCDAAAQKLLQVSCTGLCTPQQLSITAAALSDDGTSITATLSAAAAPITLVPCSGVFDTASNDALGGASALCSTSGAVLTVKLGPAATIKADQKLALLAAGGVLVGQLDAKMAFKGSVAVSWCKACVAPRVVVTGPSTITQPCAGVSSLLAATATPPEFDASLSVDPSGRAVWSDVKWAVAADSAGSAASKAVLQAAVDRANALALSRDRLRLTLTTADSTALEDAPAYKLQVTLTSWLGSSATASVPFARASSATAPAVTIVGQSSQSFKISDGLRAEAEAGSVCKGQSLEWKWSSAWSGFPASGTAGQQLFVAGPVAALHGQQIPIKITANYAGDSATSASASVTMTAEGSSPVADLTGPSGDVPDDTAIVLNATASYDPDTSAALQRLTYKWSCKREDFPTPCFTGSSQGDQDSKPGVWTLPAGLLTSGKSHTFTIAVTKEAAAGSTAAALVATKSVTLRPRSTAVPFPRGNLTRQCSAAACASAHATSSPLSVLLVIATAFTDATVKWASVEVPGVSALTVATSATDSTLAPGQHRLTIPAASLPNNRAAITITATMTLKGVSGEASVTLPINSAPYCSLTTASPATPLANAACLEVTALSDTFPTAAFKVRATGWADAQATSTANSGGAAATASAVSSLTFEFGTQSASAGGRVLDSMQQSGNAPAGTLVGLDQGNVTLYGCAIDPEGSRTCGTVVVTVKPPAKDFNASAALATVDVAALLDSNDKKSLLQAASTAASILSAVNGSDAAAVVLAAKQSVALVSAILTTTSFADAKQRDQAVSTMAAIARSSAAILTPETRAVFSKAARDAAAALGGGGGGGGTSKNSVDEGFVTQAIPGDGFKSAGDSGVYVSSAAIAPAASGTINATSTLVLAAGADALSGSGTAANATSGNSTSEAPASSSARRRTSRRALLQTVATGSSSTGSTSAEALLVLSGALATGSGGYALGLAYAPSASTGVSTILAASLPTSVALVDSGVASLSWTAVSATASAAAPALDGTNSYILLRIPAPSYDPTKSATCLLLNMTGGPGATAGSVTGDLPGLSPGAAPAAFVGYSSGRVTCRASVLGSYIVAQGPALPSPPPSAAGTGSGGSGTQGAASAPPPPPPTVDGPQAQASGESASVQSDSGTNTAAIVGGVVGGVVGVALVAGLVAAAVIMKRRKQKRRAMEPDAGGVLPQDAQRGASIELPRAAGSPMPHALAPAREAALSQSGSAPGTPRRGGLHALTHSEVHPVLDVPAGSGTGMAPARTSLQHGVGGGGSGTGGWTSGHFDSDGAGHEGPSNSAPVIKLTPQEAGAHATPVSGPLMAFGAQLSQSRAGSASGARPAWQTNTQV